MSVNRSAPCTRPRSGHILVVLVQDCVRGDALVDFYSREFSLQQGQFEPTFLVDGVAPHQPFFLS